MENSKKNRGLWVGAGASAAVVAGLALLQTGRFSERGEGNRDEPELVTGGQGTGGDELVVPEAVFTVPGGEVDGVESARQEFVRKGKGSVKDPYVGLLPEAIDMGYVPESDFEKMFLSSDSRTIIFRGEHYSLKGVEEIVLQVTFPVTAKNGEFWEEAHQARVVHNGEKDEKVINAIKDYMGESRELLKEINIAKVYHYTVPIREFDPIQGMAFIYAEGDAVGRAIGSKIMKLDEVWDYTPRFVPEDKKRIDDLSDSYEEAILVPDDSLLFEYGARFVEFKYWEDLAGFIEERKKARVEIQSTAGAER